MKKIRLPQPYAQMVVCGAIRAIPNIFQDSLSEFERVYVYADYFEAEWIEGFDVENKLHQRVWNEMTLGNIPDAEYPYNCFIGYITVAPQEKVDDTWIPGCSKYLKIESAKEFEKSSYVDNYNAKYSVLQSAKLRGKTLARMTRIDSRLYVPLGRRAWLSLATRRTIQDVYLYWETYMSAIAIPSFLDSEMVEIDEVYFQYGNQAKHFYCDDAGWSFATLGTRVNDKGKTENVIAEVFSFRLELESSYDNVNSRPLKEYVPAELLDNELTNNISEEAFEAEEDNQEEREFRNPWPRFISTPMGGQNKWKRH